ncbi:MAG: hypothetical protein AB7E61_05000 [Acholeplasmataceae bacterium]
MRKTLLLMLMIIFTITLTSCTGLGYNTFSEEQNVMWTSIDDKITIYIINTEMGMGTINVNDQEIEVSYVSYLNGEIIFYNANSFDNEIENIFIAGRLRDNHFFNNGTKLSIEFTINNTGDTFYDDNELEFTKSYLSDEDLTINNVLGTWNNEAFNLSIYVNYKTVFLNQRIGTMEINNHIYNVYFQINENNRFSMIENTQNVILFEGTYEFNSNDYSIDLSISTNNIDDFDSIHLVFT